MRINLEQARKRAKELVRDGQAAKLADAQRQIARELGFRSWPALVASQRTSTDRLKDAVRAGNRDLAAELLAEGAEPGPALWLSRDGELTALLLDAGADPNDGESLYHATETGDSSIVRVLIDRGARPGAPELFHALDYRDDLDLVRLLLDHGADVRHVAQHHGQLWVGASALHQAVLRGRSPEVVRLLVERGAPLEARDGAGRTPYALAVATARDELAELLLELGAKPEAAPSDAFLAACLRGDAQEARRLQPAELEGEGLIEAARAGNEPAVRLMLELGFPLDTAGELGGTALHFAAWHGRPEIAGLLLRAGADPAAQAEVPEGDDRTPLRWALDGAEFGPEGDHAAVAALLRR